MKDLVTHKKENHLKASKIKTVYENNGVFLTNHL